MKFLNDVVASLYGRNSLFDVIKEISKGIYSYYFSWWFKEFK